MSNTLRITGECGEAINEIKSSSSENNWVLFGYNGRSNEIKVDEKGSGGLEEFTENLNDGRIEFGFLRFDINQTQKFLFVSWCGGGVDGIRKGFFNNHTKEFENWLGEGGRGFHLQINARADDDLDPKIVLDKLNKVSSFIRATSLKSAAQDKDKAKAQSSQYWQQEKQIDAQRKEALTVHQQQQQQNLAAVKTQEQKRLEQQAKETMSSMQQQRQANVQEYQRDQQERAQIQTKMQEDKRAQILGDQARNKQSSYVAADYSHDVKVQPPAPARGAYKAAPSPAAPAPVPAKKAAPGRLASPAAFNQPPPAAAPRPGPAKPFKPAPPPVSAAPKPAKPAPPAPAYHAPEPAYEEPQQTYEEQSYQEEQPYQEDQSYQDQSYQEQAYEEPAQEAYQEPAQEEYQDQSYQDQSYQEQAYEEPAQEAYQEPAQEEYQEQYQEEQAYDDGGYQQGYSQAKALYDYAAEAATDLSFAEGDIINILEDQDPSGWWKGELNGAEGYFPSNFVEKI